MRGGDVRFTKRCGKTKKADFWNNEQEIYGRGGVVTGVCEVVKVNSPFIDIFEHFWVKFQVKFHSFVTSALSK